MNLPGIILATVAALRRAGRLLFRWLSTLLRVNASAGAGYRTRAYFPVSSATPVSRARSRKKPAWVVHELLRLAALHPKGTGCRALALMFNRCFTQRGETISKSFASYTVRNHRYEVLQLRERFKKRVPPWTAINNVWGIDLTAMQYVDFDRNTHAILGIIDHGSRRSLALTVLSRACSWTLLGHLCFAIARLNKPRTVRTDNGANLVSGTFRCALAVMGIRHQRTDVGCPWQNGRTERLFGTLKEKLDQVCVTNSAHLQSLLDAFGVWYNEIRPHQHVGGCTPMEVWGGIDASRNPPTLAINW